MISVRNGLSRRLAVFDFDHTVCEYNTDIVVRDMLGPNGIPPDVKGMVRTCGWIPYMQRVMQLLHQKGFTKNDIETAIRGIPEVSGMKSCLTELIRNFFHIIIISDSNSEFIRTWNEHNNIGRYIHTVFTNPASYNATGELDVRPYHYQTECNLSSKNLCKGKILSTFLERQRKDAGIIYDHVFYVGDGKNDVCPMLRLQQNDYACARTGYSCYPALTAAIDTLNRPYTAKILQWTDGTHLKELIWDALDL